MSTTTKPTIENPFDGGMQFEQPIPSRELMPVGNGAATDRATAAIVTAQRVAIKRNVSTILAEAKALAAAAGDKFYYSIPFKQRDRNGGTERTVLVEGLSIGGAMAALSCYGNCSVEAFPAAETQTHWTFMARFTDYEKGVTVTRSFQQRKGQSTGMRDAGRQEDIVFQIGQSKAIRNVTIGGIKWLADEMFLAAKSGVLGRIERSPDKARDYIVAQLAAREVPLIRVERVFGRTAAHWTARDMARIFTELQAIEDGFADADDLYPASQAAAEQMREDLGQEASSADNAAASEEDRQKRHRRTKAEMEAVRQAAAAQAQQAQGGKDGDPTPATQVGQVFPDPGGFAHASGDQAGQQYDAETQEGLAFE